MLSFIDLRVRSLSLKSLALFAFAAVLANPLVVAQEVDEELEARLERLEKRIEEERIKNHIPGLALAVVKDDKLVFAKGFGHRDLDNDLPVEAETQFAIGSSTKAFTSTLVAMMVDEGLMEFDSPVSQFIPNLALQVETGDEDVTIRDVLCHRTGFVRMGVLWAGGKTNRSEVIAAAGDAEAYSDFREKFHYNNVTYMMAGHAAGVAAESDWDSLIKERIFDPLGMTDTNSSYAAAQDNDRLSKGYRWDPDLEEYVELPMRKLDSIGPSGSINSNVVEMANWVRLQLGHGEFDGNRLVSSESLEETWTKQIEMAPGVGYGMGWMLHEWNGREMVEHGGNIDGFGAMVGFIPEENVGFVLLTNVTATPLQQGAQDIVFDSLLNDPVDADDLANTPKEDLSKFEAAYLATFAQFKNEKFTVTSNDGVLAVDIPGQTNFELKAPDEEGKRYFVLTDQIAVSFKENDEGDVISMTLYQGGLEFEIFREGVELPPEVPLDEIRPFVGTYKDDEDDVSIKVLVQNNQLMLELPDLGIVGLYPPDEEQVWKFRFRPDSGGVRFNRNDEGNVTSMSRITRGGETEMLRTEESDESTLPTVAYLADHMRSVVAPHGAEAPVAVVATGAVRMIHQGAAGKYTVKMSGADRYATNIDLGKFGYILGALDRDQGFADSTFSPFQEVLGPSLHSLKYRHPLWLLSDWQSAYESINVVKESEFDGTSVYELVLSAEGIPTRTLFVGKESGLIMKEATAEILPGIGQLPITILYEDYQLVGDVMIPFKVTSQNGQSGDTVTEIEKVELLEALPDETFRLTPKE